MFLYCLLTTVYCLLLLRRGRLGGEDRVLGLDAEGDGEHLRLLDLPVARVEDGAVGDERALHDAVVVEGAPVLDRILLVLEPEDAPRLRADVEARRALLLVRQLEHPEVQALLGLLAGVLDRRAGLLV